MGGRCSGSWRRLCLQSGPASPRSTAESQLSIWTLPRYLLQDCISSRLLPQRLARCHVRTLDWFLVLPGHDCRLDCYSDLHEEDGQAVVHCLVPRYHLHRLNLCNPDFWRHLAAKREGRRTRFDGLLISLLCRVMSFSLWVRLRGNSV